MDDRYSITVCICKTYFVSIIHNDDNTLVLEGFYLNKRAICMHAYVSSYGLTLSCKQSHLNVALSASNPLP